jgi:methanesulfonate monooxygenase small subunit
MNLEGLLDREAVRDLVQKNAILLDEEKLDEWVATFEANGSYVLRAYSPEIRRWMTWWQSDRPTLAKMLKDVKQHVRDPAQRRHVISSPVVTLNGERAEARAHFAIYRTVPEGQSSLYMVGRYEDTLVKNNGVWRYLSHSVIVDTRMLDTFTHIPV